MNWEEFGRGLSRRNEAQWRIFLEGLRKITKYVLRMEEVPAEIRRERYNRSLVHDESLEEQRISQSAEIFC